MISKKDGGEMKQEDKKRCSVCVIPYFERNKLLLWKADDGPDFFGEQCYFNEKRWLINRMVLGWGVVCGLDVTQHEDSTGEVVVTPPRHRLLRQGGPRLRRAGCKTPSRSL